MGRRGSVSGDAGLQRRGSISGMIPGGPRSWTSARAVMKKVRAVLGEEAMEARIRRMEKEHGYKNAMYKAERLRERMKHRHRFEVQECLQNWWLCAVNTFRDPLTGACVGLTWARSLLASSASSATAALAMRTRRSRSP